MNFSPQVKAWILLLTLALSTGIGVGVTAFLGGASKWISIFLGLANSATAIYHALSASPADKAAAAPTSQP